MLELSKYRRVILASFPEDRRILTDQAMILFDRGDTDFNTIYSLPIAASRFKPMTAKNFRGPMLLNLTDQAGTGLSDMTRHGRPVAWRGMAWPVVRN